MLANRCLLIVLPSLHRCLYCLQIQRLMLSFPNSSHGYSYMAASVVTAVALGLLVYGIPVWTMV
jgi:hypothetical protein